MTTVLTTPDAAPSRSAPGGPYPGSIFVGFYSDDHMVVCRRRICLSRVNSIAALMRRAPSNRPCDYCGSQLA